MEAIELVTRENSCRLQSDEAFLSSSHEQGRGSGTLHQSPEDPLKLGRVRVSVSRETIDDQGAGVGAGHEVEDDAEEGEDGEEVTDVAVGAHHVEPLLLQTVAGQSGTREKKRRRRRRRRSKLRTA